MQLEILPCQSHAKADLVEVAHMDAGRGYSVVFGLLRTDPGQASETKAHNARKGGDWR